MPAETLKIEFSAPNFFALPLRSVTIEAPPNSGRTYFIHKNQIVAVARRLEASNGSDHQNNRPV